MNKSSVLIILLFGLLLSSCCKCFTPPDNVSFNIISSKDSSDLIYTNILNSDSIEVFYVKEGIKNNLKIDFYLDSLNKRSIISIDEMAWESVDGNKTFFLYLNKKDIDTIYLDVIREKDGCCTYFIQKDFKINNIPLEIVNGIYNYIK